MRCVTCKKLIEGENFIVYNGKGVASCSAACFASFLSAEKEKEDRNYLYKTICRIFYIKEMTGKLYAEVKRTIVEDCYDKDISFSEKRCDCDCPFTEVKRTKEEHNLTYKNMAAILHYMYDIKGVKVYSPTLFYLPQYIDEARDYYFTLHRREEQAAEAIKKNSNLPSRIIKPNYNGKTRKTGLKINPEDV